MQYTATEACKLTCTSNFFWSWHTFTSLIQTCIAHCALEEILNICEVCGCLILISFILIFIVLIFIVLIFIVFILCVCLLFFFIKETKSGIF